MTTPHVSATLRISAHNQPKLSKPGVRVQALTFRFGDKAEPISLAEMMRSLAMEVPDFFVSIGALTERESLEQMRLVIEAMTGNLNRYEKSLIEIEKEEDDNAQRAQL